jgi:multidrug resistance efflux pump
VPPGKPKLRSDLVLSRRESAGDVSVVVKDPASGRFYRFREVEDFVAGQLDGVTSLHAVRQRAEARFGAQLPDETLRRFVQSLGGLGLLEADGPEEGHLSARPGRLKGSALYLRYRLLDPDRLLGWLAPRLGLVFTPAFLGGAAGAALLALGVILTNREELSRDLARLQSFQGLVLIWLTVVLTTALHELAHGLTCKHFGGEVRDAGVMLIYGHPAFYCNVSDAWLFPERGRRLWVGAAGIVADGLLWAAATLVWRGTERETWVSLIALVVMASAAAKTVLNLIPLIKLDGYYLVSDWLEVPNLRSRAFGHLAALLSGGGAAASPRERRIYLAYGLAAAIFSITAFLTLAVQLGGFLVARYGAVGLGLVALVLVPRGRRLLGRLRSAPARTVEQSPAATPRRRRGPLMALAGAALALAFLVPMDLRVAGEFKILPQRNAEVRAEIDGILHAVHVREGDHVEAGDPLARLAERDYAAEAGRVAAELAEKQARLRMLRAGPRQEDIAVARAALETARTGHEHARQLYEEARRLRVERLARAQASARKGEDRLQYGASQAARQRQLFAQGLISRRELEEAEEQALVRQKELDEARAELRLVTAEDLADARKEVAVAEKQVREADSRLRVLLAGSRPEEVEAGQAEIARLESQRRLLAEQLALTRLVSPIAGVVTTPKLDEKVGQFVKKGDVVAQVHELRTVMAEIAISEREIGDVRPGQRVVVKPRAYPERSFTGTVVSIAATATEEPVGKDELSHLRRVLVTTALDNESALLRAEMTGKAKIYGDSRSLAALAWRRVMRTVGVELWSWL